MGKYDNHSNAKNIAKAQKKFDKLSNKRKPNIYRIEQARKELDTAKLFESCQIFKSFDGRAPNAGILFSDDNKVMLFFDKLIRYEDIKSYRIVENFEPESHAVTKQRGAVSRAVVGGVIAGDIGAVVGAMSADSHSHTTYYQVGDGFYFQVFLNDGDGYQCYVENNGIISNKIHPKWLELGTKMQMIIDSNNKAKDAATSIVGDLSNHVSFTSFPLSSTHMGYKGDRFMKSNGILTLIAYICIALSVLGLLFVVFVLLPGEHTEPTEPTSAWTDQFKLSGYTDEEMKDINDILTSLGLTELHIEEYIENERMTIVLAKIYNSDNMQLNLTFEDHVLIYAQLTGIVETSNSWSNRTDKLKLGVGLQGSSAVDMYSDTEGGILAVLDWEAKSLERVT